MPTAMAADRAPRVSWNALHDVEMCVQGAQIPIRLQNISTSGIGALKSSFYDIPRFGETLGIRLTLSRESFDLVVKVAHLSGNLVGCAFVSPPAQFISALQKYFEIELTAVQFKNSEPQPLEDEPKATSVWYQGINNSEFYCSSKVIDGELKVLRFNMEFFGNRVEGGFVRGLRFGQQTTIGDVTQLAYGDSSEISWVNEWPSEMVDLAFRFLNAVPGLDPTIASIIADYLRQISVTAKR